MPVEQHRKLEQVADKRGLKGEERDAFIYGVMRKTGWKPKREVDKSRKIKLASQNTMTTHRIIRLKQINSAIDPVIEFRYPYDDEEEEGPNYGGYAAAGAGAAGVGVGGVLAHRAIRARQAANPGMTYVGGARDLGATGLAKTAGALRGARDVVSSTAADAIAATRGAGAGMMGNIRSGYGSAMSGIKAGYGATVGGIKAGYGYAQPRIKAGYGAVAPVLGAAAARTARAGRQSYAGAIAGGKELGSSGKKIFTHTRPTVKRLIKAVGSAARHTLSINEANEILIYLSAK